MAGAVDVRIVRALVWYSTCAVLIVPRGPFSQVPCQCCRMLYTGQNLIASTLVMAAVNDVCMIGRADGSNVNMRLFFQIALPFEHILLYSASIMPDSLFILLLLAIIRPCTILPDWNHFRVFELVGLTS